AGPSATSSRAAMWSLAITRMWPAISGLMSGNAMGPSFSPSFFAGTFPAAILQKMPSSMGTTSEQPLRVEKQSHRAFVHDPDPHCRAKDAFRHLHSALPRQLAEPRIEWLRDLQRRGIDEARTRSLA